MAVEAAIQASSPNRLILAVMGNAWYHNWFDSPYSELFYSHRNKEEAATFLDAMLQKLTLPPHACILDLGCGNGRHVDYLAKKGFYVTGIDISKKRIESALSHVQDVELFVHDMRLPLRINYYDLVMNLFTSFGYYKNDAENARILKSGVLAMRKGATFIIDYLHKERVEGEFLEQEEKQMDEVVFSIQRKIIDGCIHSTIEVIDKEKHFTFTEMVRLYSKERLEEMLVHAGLTITGRYGDYFLNPLNDMEAERCILIAQKL